MAAAVRSEGPANLADKLKVRCLREKAQFPVGMSLLSSISLQDQANGELGRNESPGAAGKKVVGSRKKYRSRSTSASSQDSFSSGSYSGKGPSNLNLSPPSLLSLSLSPSLH